MATSDEKADARHGRRRLSTILNDLQTWWLALVGGSLAMAILLIYEGHRNSPHVLPLTVISAAVIFLAGILLSAIRTERKWRRGDDPIVWLARIRCVVAIGLAVLVGFAVARDGGNVENSGVIAALGVLLAGAAWITGLLLGFIFGLPQPVSKNSPNAQSATNSAEKDRAAMEAPTNLEHIADWLTKLIVGAGLTQLTKIPDQLKALVRDIGAAMGAATSTNGKAYELFALTVCIFFPLCGFLYGYLWGRLFMPGTFRFDPFRKPAGEENEQPRRGWLWPV